MSRKPYAKELGRQIALPEEHCSALKNNNHGPTAVSLKLPPRPKPKIILSRKTSGAILMVPANTKKSETVKAISPNKVGTASRENNNVKEVNTVIRPYPSNADNRKQRTTSHVRNAVLSKESDPGPEIPRAGGVYTQVATKIARTLLEKKTPLQMDVLKLAMQDCSTRFLLPLSPKALQRHMTVCFAIQESYWWYDDYWHDRVPTVLPKLTTRNFGFILMELCPFLRTLWNADEFEKLMTSWRSYCKSIPLRGVILLNDSLSRVLMVQSWDGGRWMFPRGKVDEQEADIACAIREFREELGVDVSGVINPNVFIETTVDDQSIKLFIVPGVLECTPFGPRKRKEIGKIGWVPLDKLPGWRQAAAQAKMPPMPPRFDSSARRLLKLRHSETVNRRNKRFTNLGGKKLVRISSSRTAGGMHGASVATPAISTRRKKLHAGYSYGSALCLSHCSHKAVGAQTAHQKDPRQKIVANLSETTDEKERLSNSDQVVLKSQKKRPKRLGKKRPAASLNVEVPRTEASATDDEIMTASGEEDEEDPMTLLRGFTACATNIHKKTSLKFWSVCPFVSALAGWVALLRKGTMSRPEFLRRGLPHKVTEGGWLQPDFYFSFPAPPLKFNRYLAACYCKMIETDGIDGIMDPHYTKDARPPLLAFYQRHIGSERRRSSIVTAEEVHAASMPGDSSEAGVDFDNSDSGNNSLIPAKTKRKKRYSLPQSFLESTIGLNANRARRHSENIGEENAPDLEPSIPPIVPSTAAALQHKAHIKLPPRLNNKAAVKALWNLISSVESAQPAAAKALPLPPFMDDCRVFSVPLTCLNVEFLQHPDSSRETQVARGYDQPMQSCIYGKVPDGHVYGFLSLHKELSGLKPQAAEASDQLIPKTAAQACSQVFSQEENLFDGQPPVPIATASSNIVERSLLKEFQSMGFQFGDEDDLEEARNMSFTRPVSLSLSNAASKSGESERYKSGTAPRTFHPATVPREHMPPLVPDRMPGEFVKGDPRGPTIETMHRHNDLWRKGKQRCNSILQRTLGNKEEVLKSTVDSPPQPSSTEDERLEFQSATESTEREIRDALDSSEYSSKNSFSHTRQSSGKISARSLQIRSCIPVHSEPSLSEKASRSESGKNVAGRQSRITNLNVANQLNPSFPPAETFWRSLRDPENIRQRFAHRKQRQHYLSPKAPIQPRRSRNMMLLPARGFPIMPALPVEPAIATSRPVVPADLYYRNLLTIERDFSRTSGVPPYRRSETPVDVNSTFLDSLPPAEILLQLCRSRRAVIEEMVDQDFLFMMQEAILAELERMRRNQNVEFEMFYYD